jgi:gluconokinase
MGVSGSGKTTIGEALAHELHVEFLDADWLHSHDNREMMASGHALDDEQRLPWLHAVGEHLRDARARGVGLICACSALKKAYRDVLRDYVSDVFFLFLDGSPELLEERLNARHHEFMPASLLASQLATLEPLGPDELGMRVDVSATPDDIVARALLALGTG